MLSCAFLLLSQQDTAPQQPLQGKAAAAAAAAAAGWRIRSHSVSNCPEPHYCAGKQASTEVQLGLQLSLFFALHSLYMTLGFSVDHTCQPRCTGIAAAVALDGSSMTPCC
jgi:hypothetical protein